MADGEAESVSKVSDKAETSTSAPTSDEVAQYGAYSLQIRTLSTKINEARSNMEMCPPDDINLHKITQWESKIQYFRKKLENIEDGLCSVCIKLQSGDLHLAGKVREMQVLQDVIDSMEQEVLEHKDKHKTNDKVANVKLPKLELPTFDGKYEDWLSFSDLFKATVLQNTSLSDGQKLQYLKSSIKGDAEKVIKSFTTSDANFKPAWDALEDRYANSRDLIFSILRTLVKQQGIQKQSAQALRKLIDVTHECVRSLEVLKVNVSSWDPILVFLVIDKLDPDTRMDWSLSLKTKRIPKYSDLKDYLENYMKSLILSTGGKGNSNVPSGTSRANFGSGKPNQCVCCEGSHGLFRCEKFLEKGIPERIDFVKSKRLCFVCFKAGHRSGSEKCNTKFQCKKCKLTHNTLLHLENKKSDSKVEKEKPAVEEPVPSSSTSANVNFCASKKVLLSTALVKARTSFGNYVTIRAFIDDGAENCIITEKCAKALGLTKTSCKVNVDGITGKNCDVAKAEVSVRLYSMVNDFNMNVDALVLKQVTCDLPTFSCSDNVKSNWDHLEGLTLADPEYLKSGPVDILLGSDVRPEFLLSGLITGPPRTPCAQRTRFGWIISGPVGESRTVHQHSVKVHFAKTELDEVVKRFWQIEEVPHRPQLTKDEKYCEDFFVKNHSRTDEGRYVIPLPYNDKISELGMSKSMAEKRFLQVERKLERDPEHKKQYCDFMDEYLKLGHMELVPENERGELVGKTNYLPHHFVTKEESTTTKLRVVFDGSAKTSTGLSLNDCLLVGPTVQDDVFTHILRFRLHPIAIKADIAKMYRNFLVAPEDMDRQRILWRANKRDPIDEYRMRTITYGTASGAYCSTRCLNQLSIDEGIRFPMAASVILNDFHVDDLMGGTKTTEEAVNVRLELEGILTKACLQLRKYDSNCKAFLNTIPQELREYNGNIEVTNNKYMKALGVRWDSIHDKFLFAGYEPTTINEPSKRNVLSEMARIFDPLGWLSPVTIAIKIFFQELWMPIEDENGELYLLDWDDKLPDDLRDRFQRIMQSVRDINLITIPRCIMPTGTESVEIHAFSDASSRAYSACAYLRCTMDDGHIEVFLLAAKTKVAPLKSLTIPRLELCGALLLTRLITGIVEATKITCPIFAYSDSETVLKWISSESRRYKTFVANRISEIQDVVPEENWFYVNTTENPADCATRSLKEDEPINFELWWNGPKWLKDSNPPKIRPHLKCNDLELKEVKKMVTSVLVKPNWDQFISYYSDLNQLVRLTAYVLRFVNNLKCKIRKQPMVVGELGASEYRNALFLCCRSAQNEDFGNEIEALKKEKVVNASSKLCGLSPFIDQEGMLRLGGRLRKSDLELEQKHPIILSGSNPLTRTIVWHYHLKNHHAGFRLLWTTLKREFWILNARKTIRSLVRKCIMCKRLKAKLCSQLMGDLPRVRIVEAKPFQFVGVDYAGPFNLQLVSGRGFKYIKGYFCLFVCMSVKAIHLEVSLGLSSADFIAALKRFSSRRGLASVIFSDNGTNFVGAERELRELIASAAFNHDLFKFCAGDGIEWRFNPASSPHMAGLWEAGVKSTKYYMRRIIGDRALSLLEFQTVLCQVEAMLNSRPLCPLTDDPEDVNALTPGHFLIGRPITAVPEHDVTHLNENRLSRWERCQQISQRFWKIWKNDYLSSLQERQKWRKPQPNLRIGDLVVIKDDNLPPLKWKMGRVKKLHTGADGLVRVVTLTTANVYKNSKKELVSTTTEIQRPVVKLCLLLSADDDEDNQAIFQKFIKKN